MSQNFKNEKKIVFWKWLVMIIRILWIITIFRFLFSSIIQKLLILQLNNKTYESKFQEYKNGHILEINSHYQLTPFAIDYTYHSNSSVEQQNPWVKISRMKKRSYFGNHWSWSFEFCGSLQYFDSFFHEAFNSSVEH